MSSVSSYQETAEERRRVDSWFEQQGLDIAKLRGGARPQGRERPGAEIVELGKRRPLFTGPIIAEDDDAPSRSAAPSGPRFSLRDGKSEEHLGHVVAAGFVYDVVDLTNGLMTDLHNETVDDIERLADQIKRKFGELENAIGALKNENQSLRLILENLRITQRGERGVDGDRGPPGRDGVGQIGPAGPQGPRGDAASAICGWEPRVEQFQLIPIYASGERGPPASLRSFFEMYDAATNADDDE
jgi:hypothetical protein